MGITFYSTAQAMYSAYNINQSMLSTMLSAAKLSSGLRINQAADDPAGLVISESLRSSIASLNAEINSMSANSHKYHSASSTVQNLRSNLSGLRALAVGAANGAVNSEGAQQAYAAAADSLTATFNRIVENAEYNGANILDGSDGSVAEVATLDGIDLSSVEGAEAAILALDSAAENLDSVLVDIGATQQYEFEARFDNLRVTRQNLIAAESQLRDVDFIREYSSLIGSQIRTQAAIALLAQSNMVSRNVLQLFGD